VSSIDVTAGSVVLVRSSIKDCSSAQGAVKATRSIVDVADSVFERCDAGTGGAIAAFESAMMVVGSRFADCTAVLGGALYSAGSTVLVIANSSFVRNSGTPLAVQCVVLRARVTP
jgi:hypothetical protein